MDLPYVALLGLGVGLMFLGPLIVTFIFGVPYSEQKLRLSSTDLVIRVVTSALVGSFLTISGVGLRMGTLRHSAPRPQPAVRSTDDEFVN